MEKQAPPYGDLTPSGFLSEVLEFRLAIADPSLTADQKKRAFCTIVHHAALLNPTDSGFESAGVALKQALSSWLDFHPEQAH